MSQPPLSDEAAIRALDLVEKHGSISAAARAAGINRGTMQGRLRIAKKRNLKPTGPAVEMPEFPEDDIPVEELISLQCRRFEKRHAAQKARRWFPIKIKTPGPIGLSFVGDPHVDDDGCNLPLLMRHVEILRETEGLFACNIGDTTNNWVGRLRTLFANQEMSQASAWKMARWLLLDSGVDWLVWLLGNHDLWNDGSEIFRQMGASLVEMRRERFDGTKIEEWQAQFKLVFPNGREAPIWAAHSFPGHSQWNPLHGPQKAAHMQAAAALYVCGHTHNWALHQEESASRGFVYWLARARGYKFIDTHADKLGHFSEQEGATVTAIFDPEASSPAGFVQCYADLERAADYLIYLRKK